MSNLWDRQQNKRALAKKVRAKQRAQTGAVKDEPGKFSSEHRQTGVVVGVEKTFVEILLENTREVQRTAVGSTLSVVVGDRVSLSVGGESERGGLERLARKSIIARMRGDAMRRGARSFKEHALAANVDVGVIVAASANPAFKPRFVDRFLVALEAGEVRPLVCLTKSDLSSRLAEVQALYAGLDAPIVEVSTKTGNGIEALKKLLRGKVAVFVGQSGVGKSSLVRALIPDLEIPVQEVNAKRGSGRHTTTSSRMYEWSSDSYIIDTPGIRTFNIGSISKDQLRTFFHEFDSAAARCRFKDCLHDGEPDCAVAEDVAQGKVAVARYESYIRLLRDA